MSYLAAANRAAMRARLRRWAAATHALLRPTSGMVGVAAFVGICLSFANVPGLPEPGSDIWVSAVVALLGLLLAALALDPHAPAPPEGVPARILPYEVSHLEPRALVELVLELGKGRIWYPGFAALGGSRFPTEDATVRAFYAAVDRAVTKSSVGGIELRQVLTVGDLQALEALRERLEEFASAGAYELRVYAGTHQLAPLAPLIVQWGDACHAYLGALHPRELKIGQALALVGVGAQWVTGYFATLWEDAPYRIRTAAGVQTAELERLESDLRNQAS